MFRVVVVHSSFSYVGALIRKIRHPQSSEQDASVRWLFVSSNAGFQAILLTAPMWHTSGSNEQSKEGLLLSLGVIGTDHNCKRPSSNPKARRPTEEDDLKGAKERHVTADALISLPAPPGLGMNCQ